MDYLAHLEQGLYLRPQHVSEFAASVDDLYFGMIPLSVILIGLIAAFGWRYRLASTTGRNVDLREHVSRRIECCVAVGMFVAFLGLFARASSLYRNAYRGLPTPRPSMSSASNGCGRSSTRMAPARSTPSMCRSGARSACA